MASKLVYLATKKQKQFKWYGNCKELICRVKILLQVNNNDEKRNTFEESIRLQKEKNIYCSSGTIKVTEKNSSSLQSLQSQKSEKTRLKI